MNYRFWRLMFAIVGIGMLIIAVVTYQRGNLEVAIIDVCMFVVCVGCAINAHLNIGK